MSGTARRFRPLRRLVVSAEIPEDAPADIKEGLTRRRLVATTGSCPCGAELRVPERIEPSSLTVVAVEHEADCPASAPNLHAAMARWGR